MKSDHRMSRLFGLLVFLLAASPPLACAEPEKSPQRFARFIAVGDAPPFRQEIRDGVRYELEPPAFSIPPREILAAAGEENTPAVALRLGRITEALEIPNGDGRLLLRDASSAGKPWHELQKPASGDFLVVLWRKPGAADWRQASHLVLPDGPLANPAGTVNLINVFPKPLRLIWGTEVISLRPGARIQRKPRAELETPFQVLSQPPGGERRYFSTSLSCRDNERCWIILHRADGNKPRRPLKVLILREPAK
jgi:hypothetical protein